MFTTIKLQMFLQYEKLNLTMGKTDPEAFPSGCQLRPLARQNFVIFCLCASHFTRPQSASDVSYFAIEHGERVAVDVAEHCQERKRESSHQN